MPSSATTSSLFDNRRVPAKESGSRPAWVRRSTERGAGGEPPGTFSVARKARNGSRRVGLRRALQLRERDDATVARLVEPDDGRPAAPVEEDGLSALDRDDVAVPRVWGGGVRPLYHGRRAPGELRRIVRWKLARTHAQEKIHSDRIAFRPKV